MIDFKIDKEDVSENTYYSLIISAINLIILVVILYTGVSSGTGGTKEVHITSDSENGLAILKVKSCEKGMISILENKPDLDYINEGLPKAIQESPNSGEYNKDDYTSFRAVMVGKNVCRFVAFGSEEYVDFIADVHLENEPTYKLTYGIYSFNMRNEKGGI